MARSCLVLLGVLVACRTPSSPPEAAGASDSLHGAASEAVEPFRIVGNIYYVGARNIASYLIATPEGHIVIDTGTREMERVVPASIAKLGFRVADVEVLLSSHAHYDHVQGHRAMQRASGARVMALGDDAVAIETGKDRSPLDDEGWDPVRVDRVLRDGDTVTLGGTTLRAVWAPGHTPGCTVWTTTTHDRDRAYEVVYYGCLGPNLDVQLVGNPRFPDLVEQTYATFGRLRELAPDIYLLGHPEEQFAGKVDRIAAGASPHPLQIEAAEWQRLLDEGEADFTRRVRAEQARRQRSSTSNHTGQ